MQTNIIIKGDCIEEMKKMPENSVDAIVTDPPYGLGFMNKEWDNPNKERDLIERERERSEERKEQGKSPTNAPFSQSVRPGLAIKGAKENKWFQEWSGKWSKEAIRVLKPGGYMLVCCATRMYHRMVCGIEDAGFEIRDTISWIYGSGFPKSLNIGKSIDKIDTLEFRKQVSLVIKEARKKKGYSMDELCSILKLNNEGHGGMVNHYENSRATPTLELWKKICDVLEISDLQNYSEIKKGRTKVVGKIENPISWFGEGIKEIHTTPEAKEWEGWGTAMKPAQELIVVARKPLSEKNVALNVLKWGTGGINIDACRIEAEPELSKNWNRKSPCGFRDGKDTLYGKGELKENIKDYEPQGRFPANVLLSCFCSKMKLKKDISFEIKKEIEEYYAKKI